MPGALHHLLSVYGSPPGMADAMLLKPNWSNMFCIGLGGDRVGWHVGWGGGGGGVDRSNRVRIEMGVYFIRGMV